jgi:inhibitor of KinA sporulation pathway (predicted exonuclease)
MKVLNFVVQKKDYYKSERTTLLNDYKFAQKLGFNSETKRISGDISNCNQIIDLMEDVAKEIQKEKVFTENQLAQLQSSIHKITGDGEVMQLFNSLLGVSAGSGS